MSTLATLIAVGLTTSVLAVINIPVPLWVVYLACAASAGLSYAIGAAITRGKMADEALGITDGPV